MTQKDRNRSVYVNPEASFGTEAAAGNYLPVDARSLSQISDEMQVVDRQSFTGRNVTTAGERGADGASLTLSCPLVGFAAAGGDAAAANGGSEDALGHILQSALGATVATNGVDVTSGGASALGTGSPNPPDQHLLPVWASGTNSGQIQWRRLSGSAGTYATDRAWLDNPSSGDVGYGTRAHHGPIVDDGLSLSAYVVQDSNEYVLLGGRPTSLKISAGPGPAMVDVGLSFDSKTRASRAVNSIDQFTPEDLHSRVLEVSFNGAAYGAASVEIDFALGTEPVSDVSKTNGRSDIECFAAHPIINLTPEFATGWEDDFRAGTTGPICISFGIQSGSASKLNTVCFFAEKAEVLSAQPTADGSIIRHSVQLAVRWEGLFQATSNDSRYYMLSRA